MNITWDADLYEKKFDYIRRYGADLVELLDAPAGSAVLDLGCGNGALTEVLRERGYRGMGLDSSPELLAAAQKNHEDIRFLRGDARDFVLDDTVDAVFSNAVFHWIDREDQDKMLNSVFQALKPGGQFVFEFGGHGNNALIHAALEKEFRQFGYEYHIPFYFPTIGEYAGRLERAGFKVTYAILFPRPTELFSDSGMADWIRMFVKTPFLGVTPEDREGIIEGAVERLRYPLEQDGTWYADYVRLRMKAVKE